MQHDSAIRNFRSRDYFPAIEHDTVRRKRPLARRRASTLRPSGVDMRSRKPCLLTLFLLEGWNVLFIVVYSYSYFIQGFRSANLILFFHPAKSFNLFSKKSPDEAPDDALKKL